MTCGTRYKLHAFIQAVLNTNCCQNSATRLLITRLRISQMSKCLSSRLRETSSLCHKTFSSHYEQDHYNIWHMFSRVPSFLCLLSSYLGFRRCVFFQTFFLFDYQGQTQISTHFTITHPAPKTSLWLCLQIF